MSYKIFIYTALPCEAKPLVEHFKLKKCVDVQPFAVYVQGDICLTVTGIGKTAMAAGIAYTQALFAGGNHAVLMNIGVAGHRDYEIGDLYVADKITDLDSRRHYYPPLIGKALCSSCAVNTSSIPQLDYNHAELCDMEASAFYETATRFTTGELVHCLKVISDNQAAPANLIQAKEVSVLIAAHVATIEKLITQAVELAALIMPPQTPLFEQLIQHYHFTVSAQTQLKAQLTRWAVLTDNQPLALDTAELHNGKDVLRWIEQQISKVDVFL
jgi:nucleoside phosphorylase